MELTKILLYSTLSAVALFMGACNDDDDIVFVDGENVAVAMPEATEVGATYIALSTNFDTRANAVYTNAGYCYSLKPNPTIYGTVIKGEVNDNVVTATLMDLVPNTTYYVKAFVSEYKGHAVYSQEFEVTTAEGTMDEQLASYRGPQHPDYYVDLAGWDQRDKWNLANVHDPSVVKADDGYYYMYQTDASYGNAHVAGGHFHARRSKDLINWEYLGGTMSELPGWVIPKLNEIREAMGLPAVTPNANDFGYWAPVVRRVNNGLYRMYYSIVCPGTLNGDNSWGERSFIGMMENSDPANNDGWVDKGYVITNASDKGLNFNIAPNDWANCYYKWNAIDPAYIIADNGEHWLIYGSWNSGIAAVQVDAATGMPLNALGNPWGDDDAAIANYGQLIATRQMGNRWQASEGPEIIYRDGYYYLFLAYDALDVAYNTRVVRSTSITGPYVGIDGTDVTNTGGDALPVVTHPYKFSNSNGWVGIAHCAVFDDGNGNWYYASQGRLPAGVNGNEFSNALMTGHVRKIRWTNDGWPLVMPERYGAVPDVPITTEELLGTWEHIDLSYAYGTQKEAAPMVLTADHKVASGPWEGSDWEYDAENQILTINGVELYIQRECDWESEERKATIVYAGVTADKTYWGKKS